MSHGVVNFFFEFRDGSYIRTTSAQDMEVGNYYCIVPDSYDELTQYPTLSGSDLVLIDRSLIPNIDQVDEARKYKKRQKEGQRFIRQMGAQLNLDSILTEEEKQTLDELFRHVRDALMIGFWKTAKREMDKIIVSPPLEQSLYDYVYSTITTYITNNY